MKQGLRHLPFLGSGIQLMEIRLAAWCIAVALIFATELAAADFATKGGPEPANVAEIGELLRTDRYDLELLSTQMTS